MLEALVWLLLQQLLLLGLFLLLVFVFQLQELYHILLWLLLFLHPCLLLQQLLLLAVYL